MWDDNINLAVTLVKPFPSSGGTLDRSLASMDRDPLVDIARQKINRVTNITTCLTR